MRREQLSPEERQEYDALLADAGLRGDGTRRESHEIGPRMHRLLQDALQAGRTWAGWTLADDAEAGHLARFKSWDKTRNRVRVFVGGNRIVPRSAVVGVLRRRDDGSMGHQQALYDELTWAELEQHLSLAQAQMSSARITVATAQRLLALREHAPTAIGPAQACVLLGLDMKAYLAGEQDIAR